MKEAINQEELAWKPQIVKCTRRQGSGKTKPHPIGSGVLKANLVFAFRVVKALPARRKVVEENLVIKSAHC
eukprot:gene19741-21679_t